MPRRRARAAWPDGPPQSGPACCSGDGDRGVPPPAQRAGGNAAWAAAGLGAADLDVVEVHDATGAQELYALEASASTTWATAVRPPWPGTPPCGTPGPVVNPSGGLVARDHPIGSTGICQVFELAQHLRDDRRQRQARRALGRSFNTGGIISGDVAAIGVHVLERG